MTVKSYRQKFPNGKGYALEDGEWRKASYGILNSSSDGEIDPEQVAEIEELASELDYESHQLGILGKLASRFYGGTVETPYGTADWIGETPEEVREFVEEIESAIPD